MGPIEPAAMIYSRILAVVSVALLLWVAAAPEVLAHSRSQSYSTWSISESDVDMVFTVKAREVTRLPPLEGSLLTLESLLTTHIQKTVQVRTNDRVACAVTGTPRALAAAEGYLRVGATYRCESGPAASIILDSFFAVAPSHVHHARIGTNGSLPQEYLFTDSRREQDIDRVHTGLDSFYASFLQYLMLGVEHILGGLDHLAFLAALLLLVRNLRELIWVVSGFTVGHSITLTLAVLGHISLELWVIEALIGFTVALVAAENIAEVTNRRALIARVIASVLLVMVGISAVWGVGLPVMTLAGLVIFTVAYLSRSDNDTGVSYMRSALTLAFGMVHGFGFANVLSEIGLPDNRLAVALGGFNVGVELGQLVVVVALWALLQWLVRRQADWNYHRGLDTVSAGLCGLGVYWFVSRGFMPV
ncbi:MAG: HupE/UreJ family protein [Halioglobus sp.]